MKSTVLYVPGLGDKKKWLLWLQKQALRTWRLRGVRVEMITMRWSDDIPLRPRFEKLLSRTDELHKSGVTVSLVGVSAGASAVVSALSLRPKSIDRVITICGKLQGDVPDTIKELNPCFAESLELLSASLSKLSEKDKRRIMTLRSPWDPIVPYAEATISGNGVVDKDIRVPGHNPTCAYVLLFRSKTIAKFISHP